MLKRKLMAIQKKQQLTKAAAKKKSYTPFIVHTPTESSAWTAWWQERNSMPLKIVSIDPGTTHFCLRVEERVGKQSLKTIQFIKTNLGDRTHLKKKTVSNDTDQALFGTCAPENEELPYAAGFNGPNRLYGRVTRLLDRIDLSGVHLIVIEGQVKMNYKMTRMGQHVISYFVQRTLHENLCPLIVEVDPKLKTAHLAEKPKDVKKWSVERAREIAQERNDEEGLKLLQLKGKVNDFADTLVQVEYFLDYFAV